MNKRQYIVAQAREKFRGAKSVVLGQANNLLFVDQDLFTVEEIIPFTFGLQSGVYQFSKVVPDAVVKEKIEKYDRQCNRGACREPGAICQHTQTQNFYCFKCARQINEYHPEFKDGLITTPPKNELEACNTYLRSK